MKRSTIHEDTNGILETRSAPRDYCVWGLNKNASALAALRAMFPTAEAESMNLVFFSTSGVHGSFRTLEYEEQEPGLGVTFLMLQPRLVLTRYGVVYPKTPDDFEFLRKLRATSAAAASNLGAAPETAA